MTVAITTLSRSFKSIYERAFSGRVKVWKYTFPKATLLGVLAVLMMYVGVAGLVSVSAPWTVRGDTRQHVDYVWQVYNGHLPKFSQGIQYRPFIKLWGFKKQGVSANPPLFYIIQAPFLGKLLSAGRWQAAIALGRGINIIIGMICVIVLAVAGWVFGGKRRELFAVAVPAITALLYRFTRLNVDFAMDALLIIWCTYSLILNNRFLRYGIRKKDVIKLVIISVLGMSTKAPYIVFLATSLMTLIYVIYIKGTGTSKEKIIKSAKLCGVVLLSVIVCIGWFYYFRNYNTTGKWFSSSPEGYTGGRKYKSLFDVLTGGKFRHLFFADFADSVIASVTISSMTLAGILSSKKPNLKKLLANKVKLGVWLMMLASFAGVVLTQLYFSIGYGSINFRYLLPAVLPIGIVLSYGLLQPRLARGQLVVAASGVLALTSLSSLGLSGLHAILRAGLTNQIGPWLPVSLTVLLLTGFVLLGASLYQLTDSASQRTV